MHDELERLKTALADRYVIEREIGRGGMASVYLATDPKHNRPVAVKVLRPELTQSVASERFLREIQIAAQLNHPHILPLHDSGDADGVLYYVMPYVPGESLRDRLRREKQLPIEDALLIARQVADAVGHAHRHGIVHRDLKPENILLSGGHAVVADFGIARAVAEAGAETLTETGLAVGTPTYMSPEQATGGRDVDGRTDLYALGCVLYEMLAGEPPFSAPTASALVGKKLSQPTPRVAVVRETVPPHVDAAIERVLAKSPADRFATAEQFVDALAADDPGAARPATATKRPTRQLLVGAGALALIATAVIAGLLLRPGRGTAATDPRLLAVAPFDVLGPGLEMWGEGVAIILAQQLDGAGPLRTTPPSAVRRHWGGTADAATATQLGTRVGAGLAVYGRLVALGADSVRADATLLDVGSGTPISHAELRGRIDRIDALADTLAARFMEDLSRERSLGAVSLQSLGSSSPQAIAAFIRGEQFYRRFSLDSAAIAYRRAISIDSGFALAYNRLGNIELRSVSRERGDSLYMRAAALNHGLAVRESLVITADSLSAATDVALPSPPLIRRHFGTLETAERLYGNDVGIRNRIAEAYILRGWAVGISASETLDAFRRTIALDSAFAHPWTRLIPLTFWLEGIESGRAAIRAYLARFPASDATGRFAFTAAVVDARDDRLTLDALLDTATAELRNAVIFQLGHLQDSSEFAVELARHPRLAPLTTASAVVAYRGHLREAYPRMAVPRDPRDALVLADMAMLRAIPRDSFQAALDTWRVTDHDAGRIPYEFLAGWAGHRDTASIQAAMNAWESVSRADTTSSVHQDLLQIWMASGRAWLALARGETGQATALFKAASGYRCFACYRERLSYARLLVADGRDREAADILRGEPAPILMFSNFPGQILWALERARVNERLGNTEQAISDYTLVSAVWRNADDVLQPFVTEAHEALRRLTGEGQR